ncbi:MAG: phosphate ABC transporter ATP-binding protein [Luteolibacter sp.]
MPDPILNIRDLTVTARGTLILDRISIQAHRGQVLGIIGPSGAGKSTLLRAINRILELQPGYRVKGEIRFHGHDIHHSDVDPDTLRQRIGMIFQQPVVFPTTIAKNLLFGAARLRRLKKAERVNLLESSLREAALWDEVKDRLHDSALRLSIGQQQRLCLARTLALDPEVILMDEPTSALDPKATEAIEERILAMKATRCVVLVTHNLDQARRVTDWVACLCADSGHGEMLESACCDAFFSESSCRITADEMDQEVTRVSSHVKKSPHMADSRT